MTRTSSFDLLPIALGRCTSRATGVAFGSPGAHTVLRAPAHAPEPGQRQAVRAAALGKRRRNPVRCAARSRRLSRTTDSRASIPAGGVARPSGRLASPRPPLLVARLHLHSSIVPRPCDSLWLPGTPSGVATPTRHYGQEGCNAGP